MAFKWYFFSPGLVADTYQGFLLVICALVHASFTAFRVW
jgi:hypothetical protein